jgi:hypothetical protein
MGNKKNQDLLDPKDIGTAKRAKSAKPVNTNNKTVIRLDGFYGLLMIPVLVSMGYNTFLVLTGTNSQLNQILAVPTLSFIAYVFIRKMWK